MKNRIQHLFYTLLFISGSFAMIQAQSMLTSLPNASPKGAVFQQIGLTDVKVVYHRPFVKDREIWGKLVPYDQVWRAGANQNTIIKFSDDVEIEGQALKAGVYGLHMIPGKEEWSIIFSNNSTSWGSFSYNPEEDALRVNVKPTNSAVKREMLTYTIDGMTPESAVCALEWDHMRVPFTMKANVHEAVIANLKDELRTKPGWTWIGWNEAANYCLQNEVALEQGLAWAQRSVFMNPIQQNIMTKAQLTAKVKGVEKDKEGEVILASLESDLNSHPVTWKEWHAAANYCVQNGEMDKGLEFVNKSVAMSPSMSNMMTKSNILTKMGKEQDALMVKKDAISKGSNAELNNYGYQLMFGGDTAGAVEIMKANTDKHSSDPNVWDSLGEAYLNNGQNDEAIKSFKKSLSLNPPANVRANSIKLLSQLGVDYKEITP